MKGSRYILGVGIAAVAVLLAVPMSHAQSCGTPQEFGAQGNAMFTGRIIIDITSNGYSYASPNKRGSVWNSGGAGVAFTAGDHFTVPTDTCPQSDWWDQNAFTGANAGIQGSFGVTPCGNDGLGNGTCPTGAEVMTTLLEDSIGTNAGFIAYSVDATFAGVRPWDHARTAGIDGVPLASALHTFNHYPMVQVTSSAGPPPTTTLTNGYVDLGLNFHGAGVASGANSTIVSYDIVAHHGVGDPGRLRLAYNQGVIATVPYAGAVAGHMVAVPCPTQAADTFLAVGATFVGGVQSIYVGKTTAVECDPNIATPGQQLERAPQRSRKEMGQFGR